MKKRKKVVRVIWGMIAILTVILIATILVKQFPKNDNTQINTKMQSINAQKIQSNTDHEENETDTNVVGTTGDYTSYTGEYHDSNRQSASLTISITDKNHITGTVSDDPSGHEASVNFDTYIVDNQADYYFDDDERGGHGTMTFSFQEDKIVINIDDYQSSGDAFLSYGIQGEYNFTNDGSVNSELIEYKNLKKYDSTWTYDEVDIEIQKRSNYSQSCSFWNDVVSYWENDCEVRDISFQYTYLFDTDNVLYTYSDFNNVPKLIIKLAKNEIYARHGYLFEDEDLLNYFLGQLWYVPTTISDDFDTSCFSEVEKQNLELLNNLLKK